LSAGRIVASKYCLLYELGRGGMGSVWLAEHLTLRSHVAVKLIDPALTGSADALRRFEREARAAASLRSPHVVQVLDFGVDGGRPYLVMEFLNGESLGTRLSQRGKLAPDEVWTVMSQLGRAMARAHREGFVHRDLKPDNIFLVHEGPDFFVKVLDFGIAKALRPSRTLAGTPITETGVLLGTPHHMSPEQAEGLAVDARSDVFSMGVVAFECLTGRLPFDGASLPALLRAICYDPIVVPSAAASVPRGFDAWFAKAVARDREARFQSAEELVDALEPILREPREDWTATPSHAPTLREVRAERQAVLRLDTYPGVPPERRAEVRVPSSIPAGINGQRDLRHTALIHNASRTGALLATRHPCHPGQELGLTLHWSGQHHGHNVSAVVVRVEVRQGDPIWKFDVGVRFEAPLDDALVLEIERRAAATGRGTRVP
jgi:serine/threonine-protein kinase